jgi:hypothetical protein
MKNSSIISGQIRLEYINRYDEIDIIDTFYYSKVTERNKIIRLWRKLHPKEINMFYFVILPTVIIKKDKVKLKDTFYKTPQTVNKKSPSNKNFDLRRFDH